MLYLLTSSSGCCHPNTRTFGIFTSEIDGKDAGLDVAQRESGLDLNRADWNVCDWAAVEPRMMWVLRYQGSEYDMTHMYLEQFVENELDELMVHPPEDDEDEWEE